MITVELSRTLVRDDPACARSAVAFSASSRHDADRALAAMAACAGLFALGRRIPPSTTAKLAFSIAVIAATAAAVALFRLTGSAGPVASWLVADVMPVRTSTVAAFALSIGVLSVHPPDGVRYLSDACGGAACTVDSGGAAFPLHVVWVGSAMPAAYRANIRYLALQHRHRPERPYSSGRMSSQIC